MFNPVEFFGLAEHLHSNCGTINTEAASIRGSIGRAYYSAFLVARNKAGITAKDDVHAKVISHYMGNTGTTAVAARLKSLRALRQDADYEMGAICTTRQSGQALNYARAILKDFGITV